MSYVDGKSPRNAPSDGVSTALHDQAARTERTTDGVTDLIQLTGVEPGEAGANPCC